MPDGEVRIYCTRTSSLISYFVANDDDTSTLIIEPSDAVLWQSDHLERVLAEMRSAVLAEVGGRLNCPADKVELRSISDLILITDQEPEIRHPWQAKRRAPAKRLSR